MKIYELWWNDPWEGCCMSWHGTQPKAEQAKAALMAQEEPPSIIMITECVLDEGKRGIVAFLNQRLTKDNG